MPTAFARFEPCKKSPERGTVYYRIYKGHNRRMEFSSRLRLPVSSQEEAGKRRREEFYTQLNHW